MNTFVFHVRHLYSLEKRKKKTIFYFLLVEMQVLKLNPQKINFLFSLRNRIHRKHFQILFWAILSSWIIYKKYILCGQWEGVLYFGKVLITSSRKTFSSSNTFEIEIYVKNNHSNKYYIFYNKKMKRKCFSRILQNVI